MSDSEEPVIDSEEPEMKSRHSRVITLKSAVDLSLEMPLKEQPMLDKVEALPCVTNIQEREAFIDPMVCFYNTGDVMGSKLVYNVKFSCGSAFKDSKVYFSNMRFHIPGTSEPMISEKDEVVSVADRKDFSFTFCRDLSFTYLDAILLAASQNSSVVEAILTCDVAAYRGDEEIAWSKISVTSCSLPEKACYDAAKRSFGPKDEDPLALFSRTDSPRFHENRLTNFVVVGAGCSLHCHRSILAMKSPVLEHMLLDDVKETNEGKLTLREDDETLVQADVAEAFLMCIYDSTYRIELDDGPKLVALCRLFHMYEIESCLQRCSAAMVKKLSQDPDAAVLFLPLAKAFNLKVLLLECASALPKLLKD